MKKVYDSVENTPLKFYRLLKALLPISFVLGTFGLIILFLEYSDIPSFYTLPLFWLDLFFRVLIIVLLFSAASGLSSFSWYGVEALYMYDICLVIYRLIYSFVSGASLATYFGFLLAGVLFFLPNYVYFSKRRLLFSPPPDDLPTSTNSSNGQVDNADFSPAIPADKTTDGPISENTASEPPIESKKPFFERYDTYISCPSCGSLVPKGTKQCSCGYDLSGPASRIGSCLRRFVPILLCLLLIIAGTAIGYYAGQKSMDSELEKQYTIGYESGHDAGSKSGYSDGYNRGIELGSERVASDFKNYYQDGYYDAMDDIGRISDYTPTYFDGLGSLHTRLAKSFFLVPNRSKQESTEILQASGSIEMPRLSGGKLVPIK